MEEETYNYLSTFEFGQEIYDRVEATELLPVQKTYRWFNQNLINHGRGKDKVFNEYSETLGYTDWYMSGDMQEHQVSAVGSAFTTDRFGDEVLDLDINQYDPWIQGKLVHMQSRSPFRMPLDNGPIGQDQRIFNWLYPVEELVETGEGFADSNTYGQFVGRDSTNNLTGPNPVPLWEKELYDVWWQNLPIYFHASPGGWNWSGTGGWGQPWRGTGACCPCPDEPVRNYDWHRTNSGIDIRRCYTGSCTWEPVIMKTYGW